MVEVLEPSPAPLHLFHEQGQALGRTAEAPVVWWAKVSARRRFWVPPSDRIPATTSAWQLARIRDTHTMIQVR